MLCRAGRIELDYFKTPDWPFLIEEAEKLRPAAVHFRLSTGGKKLKLKDLDLVEKIADQTKTPFVNLHLEAKLRDYPGIPRESQDPLHFMQVLSQAVQDTELVVNRFGKERVIVENLPYRRAGSLLRLCAEPDFISRVVAETGCGFLLDIPHARISALNLPYPEQDYFTALPVQSLRELHFTGVHSFGDWQQDHMPAESDDWATFDWVLEQIQHRKWPMPWMIAYEVGGIGEKFAWRTSAQPIERDARRIVETIRKL